jgi:hypothetical protein
MERLRRRWTLATLASALTLAGGVLAGTHLASAASVGCQVDYAVSSQWQGGFGANVTLTNLGDPVSSWRLAWSFGAGQTITQLWNGSFTQSGAQVTVANASYNGAIPTGGTTSFGFNGAWTTSNPSPASFTLNGVTCTGSVTGSPSPSSSLSPSASPSSSPPPASLPCDLYAAGGTPCVAAHSTVRALYRSYNGPLYQVRRSSDRTTRNIGVLSTGGGADATAQDAFCAGTTCVITIVYDQSGHGNDLAYQGPGGAGGSDTPASATGQSLTLAGNKAYALFINPGNSYWHNGSASGMPTGSQPQGAYMVTSGTHVNSGCCFDYGNSETDRRADGAGAMDAISFSTSCWFGGCSGSGPWVQADLEFGLYSGGSQAWNPNQQAFTSTYVTAVLKNNGTSQFALKGGNAQSGGLTTLWNGALPPGYSPMKQQGAIILGSGGDCCNGNTNLSIGTFYEGAIVAGYPSDATDNAVQADITSAGYR